MNKLEKKAMNVIWRVIEDYCENCINDSEDRDEEIAHIERAMDIIYDGVLRRESEVMRKGAVIYSSLSKRGDEFKELSLTSPSDKAKALQAYTLFYTGKINIGDIDVEILQQNYTKKKNQSMATSGLLRI